MSKVTKDDAMTIRLEVVCQRGKEDDLASHLETFARNEGGLVLYCAANVTTDPEWQDTAHWYPEEVEED